MVPDEQDRGMAHTVRLAAPDGDGTLVLPAPAVGASPAAGTDPMAVGWAF